MTPALLADGVTVEIGGLRILDHVHLSIRPGERRVILGPNGAGKTTLFNVLTGLTRPTHGRVVLHDADITNWAPHRRSHAGLSRTFQITNLMGSLSVRDNVNLALASRDPKIRRDGFRALSRRRALLERSDALLARWGLANRAHLPVQTLSYGDRRHLEIIVAVACEPSVLLLDEPTAGLSPADTTEVMELIHGLERDLSIVVIEHDLTVAFRLADSVTVLAEGRVHAEGPANDIGVRAAVDELYVGAMRRSELS